MWNCTTPSGGGNAHKPGVGGSSPIRMYDENQIAGKREGGGDTGSILVSHDIPGLVR
jgi:hypothetical protein